jgi:hypothetical protein
MLSARQSTLHSHSGTLLAPSALYPSPVTNSRRMRISSKHTRNPSRIRTSKTQDLKLFRMNTYKKLGRGSLLLLVAQTPVCALLHPSSAKPLLTLRLCVIFWFLLSSLSTCVTRTNTRNSFPLMDLLHNLRTPRGGGTCSSCFLSENFQRSTIDCRLPVPLTQSTSPNTPSPLSRPPPAFPPKSPAQSSPRPRTSSLSTAQ